MHLPACRTEKITGLAVLYVTICLSSSVHISFLLYIETYDVM